jgi:hypothetical protein
MPEHDGRRWAKTRVQARIGFLPGPGADFRPKDKDDQMKNNRTRSRRRGGLQRVVIMAALAGAALLAACSGGSHTSAPDTAPGGGGPTAQQVDAYMQCMRSHGMANFYLTHQGSTADENPSTTIGFLPYGVVNDVNTSSPQFQAANKACQHLIPGRPPPPPTAAQLRSMVRGATCMRAHGFPEFPDPDVQNGQLVSNLPTSIDISSPQFLAALKICHPFDY